MRYIPLCCNFIYSPSVDLFPGLLQSENTFWCIMHLGSQNPPSLAKQGQCGHVRLHCPCIISSDTHCNLGEGREVPSQPQHLHYCCLHWPCKCEQKTVHDIIIAWQALYRLNEKPSHVIIFMWTAFWFTFAKPMQQQYVTKIATCQVKEASLTQHKLQLLRKAKKFLLCTPNLVWFWVISTVSVP